MPGRRAVCRAGCHSVPPASGSCNPLHSCNVSQGRAPAAAAAYPPVVTLGVLQEGRVCGGHVRVLVHASSIHVLQCLHQPARSTAA